MPSIPLHPTPSTPNKTPSQNPLPQLLHTPSGLALLEIQGTINMPAPPVPTEAEAKAEADAMDLDQQHHHHETSTPIGRLVFPDIQTDSDKKDSTKAQRVYLYVGKHQRLTGTLKKLPKPLGVIRRRDPQARGKETSGDWAGEELEVVDIVEWKLLFSSRPEPVSE